MLKTPLTGVDRSTSFTVTFSPDSPSDPNTLAVQAVLSCNMNAAHQTGVIIRYERGTIAIAAPIYCPQSFTVQYFKEGKPGTVVKEETRRFEYVGVGWHFEADEVARCVRDGKAQSEIWGHDRSLLEMEIFDEVRHRARAISVDLVAICDRRSDAKAVPSSLLELRRFSKLQVGCVASCSSKLVWRMYVQCTIVLYLADRNIVWRTHDSTRSLQEAEGNH